jgi:hypothetical protein
MSQFKRERGKIAEAEAILGLGRRDIQIKAARGALPGAVKLFGSWTFDLDMLRDFVRQEELRQCQQRDKRLPVATGAVIPSGAALRSTVATSDGRYRQIIRKLQRSAARQEKIAS